MIGNSDIKEIFLQNWQKWQEVIASYSDASPAKSKLLASIDDTGNKFSLHLLTHLYIIANKDVLALKRLVAIFMTKGSDFNNLLEMLYSEYEVSILNNQ